MVFLTPTYPLHQLPCECSPRLLMGAPVPAWLEGPACASKLASTCYTSKHKHKVRTCCKRLQMASGRSTPPAAWSRSAPGIVQLLLAAHAERGSTTGRCSWRAACAAACSTTAGLDPMQTRPCRDWAGPPVVRRPPSLGPRRDSGHKARRLFCRCKSSLALLHRSALPCSRVGCLGWCRLLPPERE